MLLTQEIKVKAVHCAQVISMPWTHCNVQGIFPAMSKLTNVIKKDYLSIGHAAMLLESALRLSRRPTSLIYMKLLPFQGGQSSGNKSMQRDWFDTNTFLYM